MLIKVTSTYRNPLSARLPGGGSITFAVGEGSYERADVEAAREHTGLGVLFGTLLKVEAIDLEGEVAGPVASEAPPEPEEVDPRVALHWRTAEKKIAGMTDLAELRAWLKIETKDSVQGFLAARIAALTETEE